MPNYRAESSAVYEFLYPTLKRKLTQSRNITSCDGLVFRIVNLSCEQVGFEFVEVVDASLNPQYLTEEMIKIAPQRKIYGAILKMLATTMIRHNA